MTHDDFGFDPADTELARQMAAAAPPAGDADTVLTGLRPRLTRARHRRQAGFVVIATAALMLLAGVAFATTGPDNGSKVRVPPADRSPVTVDPGPAPTTPTEPTSTPDGRTTTTPTTPSSTQPAPSGTTTPVSPPTTVDDHGGNRGPGGTSGSDGSGSNSGSGSGSSGSGSGSGGSGSSGKD